jgi:hypothetical protein
MINKKKQHQQTSIQETPLQEVELVQIELETSSEVELAFEHIQYQKPRSLHIYVWGIVGIWLLFVASFGLAFWRVAQSEKFTRQPLMQQPLNSISWSENQKDNLTYPEPKKK